MDKSQFNINTLSEAELGWEKCLGIIKDNVNWRTYQTWFEPVRAVALTENILTLQVPSQFFYEWLEEHYVELLGKTIKRVLGKEGRLEYRIIMESGSPHRSPASVNMPGSTHNKPAKETNFVDMPLKWDDPHNIKTPYAIPGLKRMQIDPQLNANYTFENYVEGDCNRVARSAGMHIAKKPGTTSFNPLVVYGGVGWGKTHLVQAIGNETRRLHPNKSVLYVSAEKFINQFIDHSKNNEINDFIHFYQLIDVLILDDIHLFIPANKTQDVFFAIFNHLHQGGKQIILTSDTPPKDLDGMQERLLSRFRWGLNADIQAPDFETRQLILQMKMRQEGLEIPDDVVKYIAYNVQSNVRELEGAVIALFAQATLNRKEIDLELAKRVMRNFVKTAIREITIENIQKMVCDYYHIAYDKLLAKTRKREVVQARQITMYLAKKFTKSSLKNIGEHFGGFDHTTVIHSCQTVENLMDTDVEYKEHLLEIQQKVQLASI
ncbi:MAG: chromosomal replication initiator protein DnaA [Flavipsychrobacter sp.]|nr:chromosomal replication initiator protein DnaA [Flavipsychrobacter sp.]